MAYFASVMKYWLFVVISIHFLAMFIWISLQNTRFSLVDPEQGHRYFLEICFKLVASVVHIFCFFNLSPGRTFIRYIIFYTMVYIENMGMVVCAWYYKPAPKWYDSKVILIVSLVFFLGIIFQLFYYQYVHPNKTRVDGTTNCLMCLGCSSNRRERTETYCHTSNSGEVAILSDNVPHRKDSQNENLPRPSNPNEDPLLNRELPEFVYESAC